MLSLSPVKCHNCDSEFVKEHSRQNYCNSTCRHSAAHKRQKEYKANWNLKNSEKVAEYKRKYAKENKELRVEQTERYRKANMAYYNQYMALRSRKKQQAKIKSLNELDELVMEELYDLARRTGMEVDHIIPLTHKKVSGLHCPWNLQLLTRTQNAEKSNKFNEEYS